MGLLLFEVMQLPIGVRAFQGHSFTNGLNILVTAEADHA